MKKLSNTIYLKENSESEICLETSFVAGRIWIWISCTGFSSATNSKKLPSNNAQARNLLSKNTSLRKNLHWENFSRDSVRKRFSRILDCEKTSCKNTVQRKKLPVRRFLSEKWPFPRKKLSNSIYLKEVSKPGNFWEQSLLDGGIWILLQGIIAQKHSSRFLESITSSKFEQPLKQSSCQEIFYYPRRKFPWRNLKDLVWKLVSREPSSLQEHHKLPVGRLMSCKVFLQDHILRFFMRQSLYDEKKQSTIPKWNIFPPHFSFRKRSGMLKASFSLHGGCTGPSNWISDGKTETCQILSNFPRFKKTQSVGAPKGNWLNLFLSKRKFISASRRRKKNLSSENWSKSLATLVY